MPFLNQKKNDVSTRKQIRKLENFCFYVRQEFPPNPFEVFKGKEE